MSLLLTLNICTPCLTVSIANFEHAIAGWVINTIRSFVTPKNNTEFLKSHFLLPQGHIYHFQEAVIQQLILKVTVLKIPTNFLADFFFLFQWSSVNKCFWLPVIMGIVIYYQVMCLNKRFFWK